MSQELELSAILAEAAAQIQQTEPPKSLPFNKTQFEVFTAVLAHMVNDAARQAARLLADEGGDQSFWNGGRFPLYEEDGDEDGDEYSSGAAAIQMLGRSMKELQKLQEAVPTLIQSFKNIEECRYPQGAPWAQEEAES